MQDTIFALATAPGRAAVAVIRVSGPQSAHLLERLGGRLPAPRRAAVRRLYRDQDVLDEALVLWLPGPGSFTGEDSAELHLHGGQATVEAVSKALADLGLRLAEPGEFSRRAFQNGKLDLTQAEAIADLVDAETDSQRRQALGQLEGELSARYQAWRQRLIEALARLEAAVDFPDEDLPEALDLQIGGKIAALAEDLETALADEHRGERVREGYRIALIGAPNAGKSSLLNRLAGREAAIVTDRPGTTRDVIEVPAIIGGFRALYADMAGIRETDDPIELEGVRRARAWAKSADLRLWVVDGSGGSAAGSEAGAMLARGDLVVLNKADRAVGPAVDTAMKAAQREGAGVVRTSALSDQGVRDLVEAIAGKVRSLGASDDFPAVTRLRHRRRLEEAAQALRRGGVALAQAPELAAEDLRHAATALGRIAGRIDPEEVLGEVFSSFCIGK
ncbi:MAG TPA: tRNA uridine-5-carboxymethylaminomethyl(34) synthesis GTPase MnmE [Caulobacteraceae bacterium]|nr:tRNA uridine-5-carboxymethylaminomethyl(34) synthesis GTPase MnmE [Caulobacteraceae bacterium]